MSDEAARRARAAVLEPWFVAPLPGRGTGAPFDVLEVGAGRWASSFDPKTRFTGIEVHEETFARANSPEGRFDLPRFPYDDESLDLVFSVTAVQRNPVPVRRTLLSEMWRVTRPGGRLLFLEDFVFACRSEKPNTYPMSITQFVELILDATAGRVVLEHVESLRYPGEDLFRGGLISLSRLGVPKM